MQKVKVQDLGRIDYKKAWDYQQSLNDALVQAKRTNRKEPDVSKHILPEHHFLFCEHHPVYTLGKSGKMDHLLLNEEQLTTKGIQFYKINRGGDITFHGLGQVVGYPILDLEHFFTDVHKYVRFLEEAVIRTLAEYGIDAGRIAGLSGVWLEQNDFFPKRKICAIGVHLSRWCTLHGFALNVNTDLNYFRNIIPCGIQDEDKTVTTMQFELQKEVDMEEVKSKLIHHFADLFQFEIIRKEKNHTS